MVTVWYILYCRFLTITRMFTAKLKFWMTVIMLAMTEIIKSNGLGVVMVWYILYFRVIPYKLYLLFVPVCTCITMYNGITNQINNKCTLTFPYMYKYRTYNTRCMYINVHICTYLGHIYSHYTELCVYIHVRICTSKNAKNHSEL